MSNELKIRKKPKKVFTKEFLGDAEAYLFELSCCDSPLASKLHNELDAVVSKIRMYYD
ncbi:MAG: hypothetical protein [Chaetfec virus UA24_2292]|nr:MAG: hypothetical protein [Chaetfec virus UA24_2292]